MINTNVCFEKKALKEGKKKHLMMLEIEGIKKEKKKKRNKLNIAFAIDISGSMQGSVDGNVGYFPPSLRTGVDFKNHNEINSYLSKIDLAIEATVQAIGEMKDGDYVSIVAFDNRVDVIVPSVKLTKNNRLEIIAKIQTLQARGGTDLHRGWLDSCSEVAKNLNEKYMNRVILLTDGQTNCGVTNPDTIMSDVASLYSKDISTTCFGVGENFNESLLEGMSNSGGGNFYYIEKKDDFVNTFNEEFKGISNVVGFDAKLELKLNKGFKIKKNYNNYSQKDGVYNLPNILGSKKIKALFELRIKDSSIGIHNAGKIFIRYKNDEGEMIKFESEIIVNVVDKSNWKNMKSNQDVVSEKLIIDVAKEKEKAILEFRRGNIDAGRGILTASVGALRSSEIQTEALLTEANTLETTMLDIGSKSNESLSKTLHYQSYRSRTSKD